MDKSQLARELGERMRALTDEPMAKHTTMRVGGPADVFVFAKTEDDVRFALELCQKAGVPIFVLGNGSNIIVLDGGIRGVVLSVAMDDMGFDGLNAFAEAGCRLSAFVMAAKNAGLMGLEFTHGIPGSVGGALAMNAGAYDGVISERLVKVEGVRLCGEKFSIAKDQAGFGYRCSIFQAQGMIVTRAHWTLLKDDGGAIGRIEDYAARRREKQPLNYPSAGSVFKRPPGSFAGKLIEDAGLKGMSVGGAMVSEKHAGFIVNTGGASASDVISLIELVGKRVLEHSGIALETEVRIVGE